MSDELQLLEPLLAGASPCAVVAHSYGGAIALMAAVCRPERVRALALYEPTLFALVDQKGAPPNGVDGIREAVRMSAAALDAADRDKAAEHFIDFWMGAGSWRTMPPERKPAVTESIRNVRRWAYALFSEPTTLRAFATLEIPILYMLGRCSPESSRAVADVLIPVLGDVRVVEFAGLGHMGPITHPDIVNDAIAAFLDDVAPG